ncbi:hypothetical protein SMI01S_24330 [Sphingobacterium mizutaii NBRC 14946 = DSM 11724]|uniref:Uncharacterized protein n=2 Tax=Sphingobacterium mizutaii TaxID=1010 RepID=A0AAJ5C0F1_9SPHI|nr:hypothetical protein [Sphingobacterium mizutaii]GEM68827.1 hypothetical protein SMI01S_24330 [Sphingobacterium mizutaii NBRC 14946 = DSM 11724]SDL01376.1 hypothetical protein SAMN05192578_101844 [Sphingobacterium mizutaii]SNV50113.1 Uncharacterised protein [Sphingobacterium mizutaii]
MVLKNVLLINAISSGMTGLLIALNSKLVASIFKVSNTGPIIGVGIFLVIFSLFVLFTVFMHLQDKAWTKFIIGIDITWVLLSVIATALLYSSISMVGSTIILAVAAWVGLMAYLQTKTLNKV